MTEKNKNKKEPIFEFEQTLKSEGEDNIYKITIKNPTRSMISEADMFYSIQINKYIKMGLLTAEQLAKKQIDIGGVFSKEQQEQYSKIQALLSEKEEMLIRLISKKDTTENEEERKKILRQDISILKTQLTDYEYIKNQVYEHTANSKARNDVILWWILNLTWVSKNESEPEQMFKGQDHESRKLKLDEMEDNEDELISEIFGKLAKIITLWYWMGITEKNELQEILKQEENA